MPHDAASSGASSTRVNASPATDASAALLSELISLGLRHIIDSPGSRSQALALLAAEFERRGDVQLHVRIDERVAGFLALGIGRESRMPAKCCTAPDNPIAIYSSGATTLPVWPTCIVCGTQPADFLERCAHFTHCPASFTKP